MMQKEFIVSAGIDIGTSTTKMVFSELEVKNTAGFGSAPRIEITSKRILHRSPIYRTPLIGEDGIDITAIHELILQEYEAAHLTPAQIQTGAILITGETATKQNAEEVIHTLADAAGDFLVATAGADLEGILAAKGSGAFAYSGMHPSAVIANVDIGGGTANIAVMQNKQLLGTCTLHVGGRLIEFQERQMYTIAPPIKRWMEKREVAITNQLDRSSQPVQQLVEDMIAALKQAISGVIKENHPLLLGHPPNWTEPVDTVMFSGGVAMFLHNAQHDRMDDIGGLIAHAIQESELYKAFQIVEPTETVAATVIGASTQTTELSGATIHVTPADLPVKNCPIIPVDLKNDIENIEKQIPQVVQSANFLYRLQTEPTPVAWFIYNVPRLSFRDVERIARSFKEELDAIPIDGLPSIFIFQQDYGRVFGQTFLRIQPNRSIISIDEVRIDHGDYIDIGRMMDTGVVPVVIKTLAFQGK